MKFFAETPTPGRGLESLGIWRIIKRRFWRATLFPLTEDRIRVRQ